MRQRRHPTAWQAGRDQPTRFPFRRQPRHGLWDGHADLDIHALAPLVVAAERRAGRLQATLCERAEQLRERRAVQGTEIELGHRDHVANRKRVLRLQGLHPRVRGAHPPYDNAMRAVVLDEAGQPVLRDVPEPDGAGELVDVLACGLCGSDVEKLGDPERAGAVLGHEVVARTVDGKRVALVHHAACGVCAQCLAGHESLCAEFEQPTIRPGGFAERVGAQGWVELPDGIDDARGTMVEPLACVLRGVRQVPRGRVLVVGHGFVGHLFAAVLRDRGDEVFAVDIDPRRMGQAPDGEVDAAVLAGRGGVETAVAGVRPGGTIVVFADAGPLPTAPVYRRELTVIGVRSAAPALMDEAVDLLTRLVVPEATTIPLDRFDEGLGLFRAPRRAQGRLHAVRALIVHGPGDARIEDVPRPELREDGDVLVQIEVALTDSTDAKALRRGHPVLLGPPPSPFGHEFCGIDVATGRRVVGGNSAPCGTCAACVRGRETLCDRLLPLLNGAYAEFLLVPARIARVNLHPVPHGVPSEVAAMVEPLACCLHGVEVADIEPGDTVAVVGVGPIGLMLCACIADAGGRPVAVGSRPERRELAPLFGAASADAEGADVVIEAAGTAEGWTEALRLVRPGGTVLAFSGLPRDARLEIDPFRIHYEEVTLRGAFHHTPRTVRAALAFLGSGAYPFERLITHSVGLEGVAELLTDPPRNYLKAAVVP